MKRKRHGTDEIIRKLREAELRHRVQAEQGAARPAAASEEAQPDDRVGACGRGAPLRVDAGHGVPAGQIPGPAPQRAGLRPEHDRVQLEAEPEPGGGAVTARRAGPGAAPAARTAPKSRPHARARRPGDGCSAVPTESMMSSADLVRWKGVGVPLAASRYAVTLFRPRTGAIITRRGRCKHQS